MALLSLPNELLIQIAQTLDDESTISAFSRTCKRLHQTVNFVLYKRHIQHNQGTALLWAAENNQLQTARYLIERGVGVDRHSLETFETPLIVAAANGFSDFVEFLLNNGANVGKRDVYETAIFEAVRREDESVVCTLLEHGANTNAIDLYFRKTPLHYAVQNARITGLLLSAGARPNICDSTNSTALHISVSSGTLDVVIMLLNNGANPGIADRIGRTPLHCALQHLRFPASWLFLYGPSPVAKARPPETLPGFFRAQYVKVVKSLVKYGANPELLDADGESPSHKAAMQGECEIVRVFLEHGQIPG